MSSDYQNCRGRGNPLHHAERALAAALDDLRFAAAVSHWAPGSEACAALAIAQRAYSRAIADASNVVNGCSRG
jgi:hypothetical protein